MKIPIQNVYYLLCYAWGHMEESDVVDRASLEEMAETRDLLGKVLAEGTFRLLRRGIDRSYRDVTEELGGVRGKLEVGETLKRAALSRGRTVCTYGELSRDVLHNRILRASLGVLLRSPALTEDVRREVALAHRRMEGIEEIRVTRQALGRVEIGRNMRIYRFLLSVCRLLHESTMVEETSGAIRFRDFRREDATMWSLFEDFVAEFYRREQDRYTVSAQSKVDWFRASADETGHLDRVPEMRPDLVLESPDRRLVIDTKYTSPLQRGRFGTRKLKSGHLYQMHAYLQNRQGTHPEGPRHEGILLYPTVDEPSRVDVRLSSFRVQARSVNLDQPWRAVHRDMLQLVEGS